MKQILLSLLTFFLIVNQSVAEVTNTNQIVKTAQFGGLNGHEASGTVQLIKTDSGYQLHFGADFEFDGAPDPRLGFGKGQYLANTEFTKLTQYQGQQSYQFDSAQNLDQYSELWIWCEKFSVPIGRAVFN